MLLSRKIVKDLNNKMADFLKNNKGISFVNTENPSRDQEDSVGFRQKYLLSSFLSDLTMICQYN